MRRHFVLMSLAVVIAGGLTLVPAAWAQDRKADQILADIAKIEMPQIDRAKMNDRAAVMEYIKKRQEAMTRKADLVGELYKVDPENSKLTTLLPERWQVVMMTRPQAIKDLQAEVKEIAAKAKNEKLKTEAAFISVVITFRTENVSPEALVKAADEFIKLAPKDERCSMILSAAANMAKSPEEEGKLLKRVIADYPKSDAAKAAEGTLRRLDAIGKPFDLEFTEAIKGTTVSMKNLQGKVVVIDFWATWCGPCVAEMPNMKKLYAEYKEKGVEFIGVSLDQPKEQGGLDKLKDFVAKQEITWPQYYQGNGWESDFSRGWGINSIPAVFVIDPQGKLHSINARGKLGEMIPELLKKAKSAAGAGAGAGGN